jgi:hypothetical protein
MEWKGEDPVRHGRARRKGIVEIHARPYYGKEEPSPSLTAHWISKSFHSFKHSPSTGFICFLKKGERERIREIDNVAFHPTIKTVGFQTAFSVIHVISHRGHQV